MSLSFYLPHELLSTNEDVLDNDDNGTLHIVTPGQTITNDMAFMRGHGTYIDNGGRVDLEEGINSDVATSGTGGGELVASVCGVVDRVNKLVVVRPIKSRFNGEIGDVVVGRITEVGQKRWKVDINSRQDAVLNLSSVSLPGGIQRRKSESDELQMRSLLCEGDVLVAEVQAFFSDGAISLHTRSVKYGKLRNGCFVSVPSSLVKRCKSHFHSLPGNVDVILGLNGSIWVSMHTDDPEDAKDGRITKQDMYSNANDHIALPIRQNIARVVNCINALAKSFVYIDDTTITYTYEASLNYSNVSDLLKPDVIMEITEQARVLVEESLK